MIPGMRTCLLIALLFVAARPLRSADLHPIVQAETGYLAGASSSEGRWIKSPEAAKALKPGAKLTLYSLTARLGTVAAGKVESAGEPCPDVLQVRLEPQPEKGVIALGAPWNALPRVPQVKDTTQEVYVKAVRELLESKGLKTPTVRITQILRIDLDGDGEEEVLVSGTNYPREAGGVPVRASGGNYSFVLLRRLVNGKVESRLLEGEFYTKEASVPNEFRVDAVLDLNGDGIMEVVVHGQYYEGAWITVYRCDDGRPRELLSVGCGA